MDRNRAQDIIESHGVISVTYQDAPVWIEQVHHDDTAEVTILGTNERMEVPVAQLSEG